ncbi:prepilin-type N-terminal cleavage/methylation domain-containing protein [Thalassotalea sp. HSM 43]|uniref:type IV pilin protein n=1 Tax=Thalassotalea sp. HSM 43 TaxID=2552945 RepID=UPI001081518C|nr:type IV pilin protein [Thalassotalea sp. HSM 43]QBY06115.1 prepilin-type N-terminal cleavage/methylation domain-containing protein [Thalassotalea sp. HSM 43]
MKKVSSLRGVTLIELMITLVIIVILSSVALTNYQQWLMKVNREDAKASLLALAIAQQQHFSKYLTYSDNLVLLAHQQWPDTTLSQQQKYRLTIATTTHHTGVIDSFMITATAHDTQQKDSECFTFRIDHQQFLQAFTQSGEHNNACL